MSLDSKSVKKLYFAFVRISSVQLGLSFFITFTLLAPSYGVDSSDEPELDCTVSLYRVLTCLWKEQTDLNNNYTFDYWYGDSSSAHCPQYLVANHKPIGCRIALSNTFISCTVKLSTANQRSPIIRKLGRLQDLVKMDPPSYLHVENTSSLELLLTWNQTYGSFPEHCMTYQVQYQHMASNMWTVKDASRTSFTLPSYDPRQIYTFQVRSQINRNCGNSKFWSDWSQAVTWGRNITVTGFGSFLFLKFQILEKSLKNFLLFTVTTSRNGLVYPKKLLRT
ncbi:cytokine receptor common subunit gamma isoform X2 [Eleutherodactylus coqui]|uniref:cytokine receptor common subunit gamma isoform X2 n=1 Tax=Eleutherodactylus coqui TaxID=57060 RepID=UPI0034629B83